MRTGIRRRLGSASLAMIATLAVLLVLPREAIAIPQNNPEYPTACEGVWHWVHNQTSATEGTLTAIFSVDGADVTIVTGSEPDSASKNLHYKVELAVGATLKSASDDVDDGNLVLSHWPTCPGDTAPNVTPPGDSVPDVTPPGDSVPDVTPPDDTALEVTSPEVLLQDAVPAGESAAAVTDTTRLEVFGTTITAAAANPQASSETLPFTGVGLEATGGVAVSLLAMGGLILLSFGYLPGSGRSYRGRHRRPRRPVLRMVN